MTHSADWLSGTLAGGFCLSEEMRSVGANDYLDDGLAAQLVGVFRHSRVLDLGCGLGHYGHYLQARVRRLARVRVCQAGKKGLCLAKKALSTLPCCQHCHFLAFMGELTGSIGRHRHDGLAACLGAGHRVDGVRRRGEHRASYGRRALC